jgi:FkbM family methyltransferase
LDIANYRDSCRLYSVAGLFRATKEQRLMFLDELVDQSRNAIDIGAWYGPWSYWLARRCPQVWAFEPNPACHGTLAQIKYSNFKLYDMALSDSASQVDLFVPKNFGPDAQATVESSVRLENSTSVSIRTQRLDELALPNVGFIKIDVEGHELPVLSGAELTIQQSRPVVLIEIEQKFHKEPIDELFQYFLDMDYTGWVRRNRRWDSLKNFNVKNDQEKFEHQPKNVKYINNFVFTPYKESPAEHLALK